MDHTASGNKHISTGVTISKSRLLEMAANFQTHSDSVHNYTSIRAITKSTNTKAKS